MASALSPSSSPSVSIARGALACVVYVSEGRRLDVVKAIESVAKMSRKTSSLREKNVSNDSAVATSTSSAAGISRESNNDEQGEEVKLVKTFVDAPYNRTGFTFAVRTDVVEGDDVETMRRGTTTSTSAARNDRAKRNDVVSRLVANKVHEVAQSAFLEIGSFRKHSATHPRLGIVDHVSVHPIGTCDMDQAKAAARAVGRRFGGELGVNAYMYGYATMNENVGANTNNRNNTNNDNNTTTSSDGSNTRRELAEIRRKLGYFSANGEGETWVGASDVYYRMQKWEEKPDFGTGEKNDVEEKGVCCVGAVPFVVNYNVPMVCELSDWSQEKLVLDLGKQIAKRVSQRNEIDGLPNVQSMALMRTTTNEKEDASSSGNKSMTMEIEIACNLLDETSSTTREQVQKKIEELMPELLVENASRGVKLNGVACQIGKGYVTNLQPQDFLDAVSTK
jgi:glutamate formiminotransferase